MTNRDDVEQRARTMDRLVRRLESEGDPDLRAAARELVQALLEFHAVGLTRMLEIVDEAGETGALLIDQLGGDELVKPLLLLHGLHPLDLRTRVLDALEQARPSLLAQRGHVELVGVDDAGVVTLRVDAQGCGSSTDTLATLVEERLREAAPDITRLVVERPAESLGAVAFVPVGDLLITRGPAERSAR